MNQRIKAKANNEIDVGAAAPDGGPNGSEEVR